MQIQDAIFTVMYTQKAKDDLVRLFNFLLAIDCDITIAQKALLSIERSVAQLSIFPFNFRKIEDSNNALLREIVIPFVSSGYVVIFEIDPVAHNVTILAFRHQREEDYW